MLYKLYFALKLHASPLVTWFAVLHLHVKYFYMFASVNFPKESVQVYQRKHIMGKRKKKKDWSYNAVSITFVSLDIKIPF